MALVTCVVSFLDVICRFGSSVESKPSDAVAVIQVLNQIEKSGVEEKVSSEEVQNCEELKPSKDHVGSIKDSLFNTENMQSLFNSPIFDTFPATTKPAKVLEEVPHVHIPLPPLVANPSSRSVESRLNSMEKQVRKFILSKSYYSPTLINFR
ncbi:hypothetical protein JHK84_055494 [Glycine max]|nr:hypothetical protein JHK84_055494 [Glycine max]